MEEVIQKPAPEVVVEEQPKLIGMRNLLTILAFLLLLAGALGFLSDLIIDDNDAFRVTHRGEIPLVMNDEEKVSAVLASMMPLRPSDESLVVYVEAQSGCSPEYSGSCANVRSGPGVEYEAVMKMRSGMVLRVEKTVRINNRDWYKITFDEWVRYPDRLGEELYVASDAVHSFAREAPQDLTAKNKKPTNKHIIVDLSEQTLYAFDGEQLYMEAHVSTGLDDMPTPIGTFRIFRKMPSRYMQGPIPGSTDDEYDLPGVPWTMYFTTGGAAIHGAYWHSDFGNQHSHGCINLRPEDARKLYDWTALNTPVTVSE